MDFSEALRELKAGKILRRREWSEYTGPTAYVSVHLVVDQGRLPDLEVKLGDGRLFHFHASAYQLLAEDWEIIE